MPRPYDLIINVLLYIIATFSYETTFFALKVQHNLAQGSALGLPCPKIYAPCKGNTAAQSEMLGEKQSKNGHNPKVMPVVFIGGVPWRAATRDILLFYNAICLHCAIVGS